MNYTAPTSIAALLVAIALAYLIPGRFKALYLLVLCYLFYCTWSIGYSLLLAGTTVVTWGAGLGMARASGDKVRRTWLVTALVSLLTLLVFFKYSVVLAALGALAGAPSVASWLTGIVIPIGISYYLFKSISYVLDVYWDNIDAQRSPIAVGLYVAFFPQILSGPIQRADAFFEQMASEGFGRPVASAVQRATGFFLLSLFEKLVVADRIGAWVQALDASHTTNSAFIAMGTYGYALQLFADFSGLTHIAIGMGLFFGIEGPPNFNRPFRANNIQEYWRGWHMSLTTWLTDYLFMPLRMALRNLGNLGLAISIMVNMVLIGVWHGANWTFLVFGVIHGTYMIVSALTLKRRNEFFKGRPVLSWVRKLYAPIVTFNMVCLALLFFRAPSVAVAWESLKGIAQFDLSSAAPVIGHGISRPAALAALVAIELSTGYFGTARLGKWLLGVDGRAYRRWVGYGFAVVLIVLLASNSGGEFIYAKF